MANGGNRYATVLMYLNDVEEGGETGARLVGGGGGGARACTAGRGSPPDGMETASTMASPRHLCFRTVLTGARISLYPAALPTPQCSPTSLHVSSVLRMFVLLRIAVDRWDMLHVQAILA